MEVTHKEAFSSVDTATLIRYWILLIISSNLLVVSIIMLWTGRLPPPFSSRKVSRFFSTFLHVVGMTGTLIYGTQDLLQLTIQTFFQ